MSGEEGRKEGREEGRQEKRETAHGKERRAKKEGR